MRRYRTRWTYSAGLLVAWGLVFLLAGVLRGGHEVRVVLPVFVGSCIGWASTTIARYVYPSPKKWLS